jgi:hypothetical protein
VLKAYVGYTSISDFIENCSINVFFGDKNVVVNNKLGYDYKKPVVSCIASTLNFDVDHTCFDLTSSDFASMFYDIPDYELFGQSGVTDRDDYLELISVCTRILRNQWHILKSKHVSNIMEDIYDGDVLRFVSSRMTSPKYTIPLPIQNALRTTASVPFYALTL